MQIDLTPLEAARQMAALSPETQEGFDRSIALQFEGPEEATQAFRAIGSAIAARRRPVSEENKKRIFALTEALLLQGLPATQNAVATCMLDQIWMAADGSGFDFSAIDVHLGPEARAYLLARDALRKKTSPGLSRR